MEVLGGVGAVLEGTSVDVLLFVVQLIAAVVHLIAAVVHLLAKHFLVGRYAVVESHRSLASHGVCSLHNRCV